jgi:hypothetical protein
MEAGSFRRHIKSESQTIGIGSHASATSFVSPVGLLLLRKCLHPNLLVLSAKQSMEHPPLVLDTVPQRQILTLVHHFLRRHHRNLGIRSNRLRRLQHTRHQLLVRRKRPRRNPPLLRLLTTEKLARQNQLHRLTLAHRPRQPLAASRTGDRAQLDLGLAELGVSGAIDQVAHECQLATAAEGVARNSSEDGLLDRGGEVGPGLDEGGGVGFGEGEGRHLLDVGAGGEGLGGAREDDGADGGGGGEGCEGRVQLRDEGGGEGVEGFGAGEGY